MEFAKMMRVIMGIMMMAMAMGQNNSWAPDMAQARTSIKAIYTLTDVRPSIDAAATTGVKPKIRGNIKLRDVSFEYPTRAGKVLRGINLDIAAGSTVAIVGPSGSGKSTIIQLLQRFYDPVSGDITIDGQKLPHMNLQWLRQHIGVVSQEPILFRGSIADNIKYGLPSDDPQADNQQAVEDAAKLAYAHGFISARDGGYGAVVTGETLSGGQKQRVCIARAVIRKPPLLLLDEATSALDNASEHIVQKALDKATQGNRTTVVVAHRLSTIRNADKIVVMSDGKIVEQGTHTELTAKPAGLYKDMWQQQSLKNEVAIV